VAINCSLVDTPIVGPVGVMAIDCSVAGVKVNMTGGDDTAPSTAVITVDPTAMLAAGIVTLMDTSVAGVTVTRTDAEVIPFMAAVTIETPGATGVATPALPEVLLMVTTAGFAALQVTWRVRS
jgi:hypothetical protein